MTTPTQCVSRPDVAVLDEYCGTLPSADDLGVVGAPLRMILPSRSVRRLEAEGPLGEVVLSLPMAVRSGAVGPRARGRGLEADDLLRRGSLGARSSPPGNLVEVAGRAVTDGALHPAFGSLLLISAVGMGGAAWARARRRHPL